MIKRFFFLVGSLLPAFGIPDMQAQVLHKVSVVDHEFQPKTLRISEGDSIRWEWKGDLHNVVAVTLPGGGLKSGAFESELLNTNGSFEVEFSRELLNQYSRDRGTFEYVCEPHAFFGMIGSVSVDRVAKTFIGIASTWQAGGEGSEELSVMAELSGNERTLKLSVPDAGKVMPIELRTGGMGEVGVSVCSGSIYPGGGVDCAVEDSNQLFQGNMFVTLDSRLRAQLVRQGLKGAISGRVRSPDGVVTSGITVSAGGYSVQPDSVGNYRLEHLPYGVYRLSASHAGTQLKEVGWSNPTLLITTEVYQRDFGTATGLPGSTPVPAPTMGDVCTEIKHQLSLLSPAIHNSFDLGIQYISDNALLEFMRAQSVRVKAEVSRGITFEDAELDGLLSVSLAQGKSSGEFQVLNNAGDKICEESFAVVIESPLNSKNLYKVRRYLAQAKFNAGREIHEKRYLDDASALLTEMASGGAKHPKYPNILNRHVVERFNTEVIRIIRAPGKGRRKLSNLFERISSIIELIERENRIKVFGHTSNRCEN